MVSIKNLILDRFLLWKFDFFFPYMLMCFNKTKLRELKFWKHDFVWKSCAMFTKKNYELVIEFSNLASKNSIFSILLSWYFLGNRRQIMLISKYEKLKGRYRKKSPTHLDSPNVLPPRLKKNWQIRIMKVLETLRTKTRKYFSLLRKLKMERNTGHSWGKTTRIIFALCEKRN